jgi:PleD family two-component response regulator
MEAIEARKALILIVDDNPKNLKVMLGLLKRADFDISVARSGQEALKRANDLAPDIILLDVMMPDLDGFETCQRLKTNPATATIPVIFMTALTDVESKVKGFAAGGVDYVTKPVESGELLARLMTHLALRRLQKSLEAKNAELQAKNEQLQQALGQVKTLSGLLPICANCKKIRDDQGYWQDVAVYIRDHSEADFTHGICPDCMGKLYPDFYGPELRKNE